MSRKVAAILNPVSGRRNLAPLVHEIGRILERNGGALQTFVTERGGHATHLASTLDEDTAAVLVVGGDGTACEVINGLNGRATPMVLLQTGTENLFARELSMPTEPNDVAMTLLLGEARPVDVGVVNGRKFLAIAGVGFDAECVLRMAQVRSGHITRGDYFWPIWRTFWAHRFPQLVVNVDGTQVFEGRGLVLIGLIPSYAAGLRLLSRARNDDGLLDVCILPCAGRTKLLSHAARAFLGRHIGRGGVIYRHGRRVSIQSPDSAVPVQVDGDYMGDLPVLCEILPKAANVLQIPAIRR